MKQTAAKYNGLRLQVQRLKRQRQRLAADTANTNNRRKK